MPPITARVLATAASAALTLAATAGAEELLITDFAEHDTLEWQTVNDGVMGGLSEGGWQKSDRGTLLFEGRTSLRNNGGFSSIRSRPSPHDLSGFDGIQVRLRGEGRTYKLSLRTGGTSRWIAYWADFETVKGEWIDVRIPFEAWVPTTMGQVLRGPQLDPGDIESIGFMLYDKNAGEFSLEVDRIAAYRETEIGTLAEIARKQGTFSTLLAAAEATGLVEALCAEGPLTVFAPTDEAFAALPAGSIEALLGPENRDALIRLLQHHLVAGEVSSADLLAGATVSSLAGSMLSASSGPDGVTVAGAPLLATDVAASNGVIHVVGAVLRPWHTADEASGNGNH